MGRITEYMVIGRHLPSEKEPQPTLYRMRIFAPNETFAKSRFWYFVRMLRKMKKATGEIVAVHAIHEKKPMKVKNFAIWLRYNSRSGTHNMYKEFRAMSRSEAVEAMYQDMAARHRARFGSIHVRIASRSPSRADPADPEGGRDREDRGHPPSVHQAARAAQAALPSSPPPPDCAWHLRCAPPCDVLLKCSAGGRRWPPGGARRAVPSGWSMLGTVVLSISEKGNAIA